MYLSRVSIAKKPTVKALTPLLSPSEVGDRTDAHHRLLWMLFADSRDRERDFLWRAESRGEFLVLSQREPKQNELLTVESKPFSPAITNGDRLHFILRANATRAKKGTGRVDVVMDALFDIPAGNRAEKRMQVANTEGAAWLARQGQRSGFAVIECTAQDYSTRALPSNKGSRRGQPHFGVLDLEGMLEVLDSEVFLSALRQGFGRAKAFGCGLMLLRRAS